MNIKGNGGEGEEKALRRERMLGRAVLVIEEKKDCMSITRRAVLGQGMVVDEVKSFLCLKEGPWCGFGEQDCGG